MGIANKQQGRELFLKGLNPGETAKNVVMASGESKQADTRLLNNDLNEGSPFPSFVSTGYTMVS